MAPVSTNRFADTGFLIDVFLAGGQQALDALRDKLAGKIYITTDALYPSYELSFAT
jgi:hypothetical protein